MSWWLSISLNFTPYRKIGDPPHTPDGGHKFMPFSILNDFFGVIVKYRDWYDTTPFNFNRRSFGSRRSSLCRASCNVTSRNPSVFDCPVKRFDAFQCITTLFLHFYANAVLDATIIVSWKTQRRLPLKLHKTSRRAEIGNRWIGRTCMLKFRLKQWVILISAYWIKERHSCSDSVHPKIELIRTWSDGGATYRSQDQISKFKRGR